MCGVNLGLTCPLKLDIVIIIIALILAFATSSLEIGLLT
jgi:hypothetical protein